jgi:hypothetical protein
MHRPDQYDLLHLDFLSCARRRKPPPPRFRGTSVGSPPLHICRQPPCTGAMELGARWAVLICEVTVWECGPSHHGATSRGAFRTSSFWAHIGGARRVRPSDFPCAHLTFFCAQAAHGTPHVRTRKRGRTRKSEVRAVSFGVRRVLRCARRPSVGGCGGMGT